MKKKIIITMGDPAGCGPLITVRALEHLSLKNACYYIVGDKRQLEQTHPSKKLFSRVTVIGDDTIKLKKIIPGQPSRITGFASLVFLKKALAMIKEGFGNALVTAPVSKEAIQLVEPHFYGHTEFLAAYFDAPHFAMMMVAGKLRIVLLTRHISLAKVSDMITQDLITDTLQTVTKFLSQRYHIKKPRIAFASINPHASEHTFLGKEEKMMKTVIKRHAQYAFGPYPADTLFLPQNRFQYDCIITAYHDAAMIPFKLLSFMDGVNVTCGLPIIRTSPAHGVAFDLMKKRIAPQYSGMLAAIKLAYQLS
jgi:4-hydroxythreonine-4-phosphate dehydrogenase